MDNRNAQPTGRLEELKKNEDVVCIKEICPGIHLCRFIDYSAVLLDVQGKTIKTPMTDFDCIVDCKALGNINGKEHFILKAYNRSSKRDNVFMVFDIDGKAKTCRDIIDNPQYGINDLLRDEDEALNREIRYSERHKNRESSNPERETRQVIHI